LPPSLCHSPIEPVEVVDAAALASVVLDELPLVPLRVAVHVDQIRVAVVVCLNPVNAPGEPATPIGCCGGRRRLDEHHDRSG